MAIDFQRTPLPGGWLAGDVGLVPAAAVAFTEGPAADAEGDVYFSDIINNRILRYEGATGRYSVFRQPSGRANGLLFDHLGRLLACEGNEFSNNDGNRRITRTELTTGRVEVLTAGYERKRYNAPNDIAACSDGRIYFTDPCYGCRAAMELDHDSVYRIDPNGEVTRVLTQPEIERPNGVALSPDEQTLYLVDSCPVGGGNRKVWAFHIEDDGSLSNQRAVVDFAPGRGGDGMCVDQNGTLYIAAGIHRPRGPYETTDVPPGIYIVTPGGDVKGRIPVPEDVLTNVTFGGPDLKTLFITAGKTLYTVQITQPGWLVHRR